MPRLLLVTNTFPPHPGNSAEKMGTRVRYLHQHGWQTTVLTPVLSAQDPIEDELINRLPPVDVHRTPYLFQERMPSLKSSRGIFLTGKKPSILDYLYIPNGYIRWLPYAIKKGVQLASNVDLILSFNNPTMMHLIGFLISRLARKPWVAGLRDPIYGNPIHRRGPELFNHAIEKLVAYSSDGVVQWGDFVAVPLAKKYPNLPPDRFNVIPYTGYNPEDFRGIDLSPQKQLPPLKITYTGSFYSGSITPEPLLRALGALVKENRIEPPDILVRFAGDWDPSYDQLIERFQLGEMVEYLGFISRRDCVTLWAESHVLLVILGENFDSIDRFPAKFWDYVGAQRYMLALVPPEGKLANKVREQSLGKVVPPHDETRIADAILDLLALFKIHPLVPQPEGTFYSQDANRAQNEQYLAEFLDQVYDRRLSSKKVKKIS